MTSDEKSREYFKKLIYHGDFRHKNSERSVSARGPSPSESLTAQNGLILLEARNDGDPFAKNLVPNRGWAQVGKV